MIHRRNSFVLGIKSLELPIEVLIMYLQPHPHLTPTPDPVKVYTFQLHTSSIASRNRYTIGTDIPVEAYFSMWIPRIYQTSCINLWMATTLDNKLVKYIFFVIAVQPGCYYDYYFRGSTSTHLHLVCVAYMRQWNGLAPLPGQMLAYCQLDP